MPRQPIGSPRSNRPPRVLLVAMLSLGLALAATSRAAAASVGWECDLTATQEKPPPGPLVDPTVTEKHPFVIRIRVPWARIETQAGVYDWAQLDSVVDRFHGASHRVILTLFGPNDVYAPGGALPTSTRDALLKGWLDLLRDAGLHFRGRVHDYEIGFAPNLQTEWSGSGARGNGPTEYAYVLKLSSVTVRSADPGALVAQGALDARGDAAARDAALSWQTALYKQDVAAYLDALPILANGDGLEAFLSRVEDLVLQNDPSAERWLVAQTSDREGVDRTADVLERFLIGAASGAALVTFETPTDTEGRPEPAGFWMDLHRLFAPGMKPRSGRGGGFTAQDGDPPLEGTMRSWRFFDANQYQGIVGFAAGREGRATLVLDTAAVKGVALYDLAASQAVPVEGARADPASNTTRVPVPLSARPLVVLYARVPIAGFETEKEKVQVANTGLITVEEILAGYQRFQTEQEHRLKNYLAAARVSYHYKIEGSNTFDVAYDNQFFWSKETGQEWSQTGLYLNGTRWKGKFPDLPFIQPEKVLTLPLDIHLNEDYRYTYAGRDKVDGYDCYVVNFQPPPKAGARYEGKVWIETRTFARVRMSVVETGMEPPVTSSDERDHFGPVTGPDGSTYWLLTALEGQQIFTTAGRNLVVLREIQWRDFRINDPGFEQARQQAYASQAPLLKDTDKGLRYMTRAPDGSRTVETDAARRTLFVVGGIYDQPGLDTPVPLAGFNYFNYNVKGSKVQMNAFLAGAFNTITVTHPKLFGKVDGTLEGLFLAFTPTDHYYVAGEKRDPSNVDERSQNFAAWLGVPLGSFFRVRGGYDLEYQHYDRDQETETFTVPVDTAVNSFNLQGEFNRAGWTVSASEYWSARSHWDAWGDETPPGSATLAAVPNAVCDTPGSCLAEFDAGQAHFSTFQGTIAKQVFLPAFQKLNFEVDWLDGSNLDRFSKPSLQYFGTRVRGFSGAGVRFDHGGIARAEYAFNLGDVIRFQASLDHARVQDLGTNSGWVDFTGAGISGNTVGPWRTLIGFDIGVALQSDYQGLKGDTEGAIFFLKLF
jgi:hypothetical protein